MSDRISILKEVIDKMGKISIKELEKAFPNISSMTIRRDLKKLEENNDVLRVSGGVVSLNSVVQEKDKDFSARIHYNVTEKIEIAEKAIKIVEPKSCIFIDGGSTTTYFARTLPDDNFYILTNSMVIAETILRKQKPTVSFVGGDLRRNTLIAIGKTCLDFIDGINIQTAVMTATGYIKDTGGFSCGSQSEAEVKRKVIQKADSVIMLLDSSKVNKKTPYTFANLSDIDCMVVDSNFPQEIINVMKEKGIEVF